MNCGKTSRDLNMYNWSPQKRGEGEGQKKYLKE